MAILTSQRSLSMPSIFVHFFSLMTILKSTNAAWSPTFEEWLNFFPRVCHLVFNGDLATSHDASCYTFKEFGEWCITPLILWPFTYCIAVQNRSVGFKTMFAVLNGWPYPSNSQQKQPLSYAWFAIEAAPGVDSWIASGWLQYQCHSFIQRAGLPGILCREQLKTLGCRKSALGRTSGELSSKGWV